VIRIKKKFKNFLAYIFAGAILINFLIKLIVEFHIEIIIIVSTIVLFYLVIKLVKDYRIKKEKEKIIKSGILEIDKMTGYEFEDFLSYFFKQLEYEVVEITGKSGDYGADLIIKDKKSKKIAVQAKRYKSKVSPKAVQEVCGALGYYDCDYGIVVTNNYLTSSAKKLARKNNIEVWERNKLIENLNFLND